MARILFSIGLLVFFLTGCVCRTKYVYLKPSCPRIAAPAKVSAIDFNVTDGCACDQSLTNMVNGIKALRNSEAACRRNIDVYNATYTTEKGVEVHEVTK